MANSFIDFGNRSRNQQFQNASTFNKLFCFGILLFQTLLMIFLFHMHAEPGQWRGVPTADVITQRRRMINVIRQLKRTDDTVKIKENSTFGFPSDSISPNSFTKPTPLSVLNIAPFQKAGNIPLQSISTGKSVWRVSIHVIGFSRPLSFGALLAQLAAADYSAAEGTPVDLVIRIDGNGPAEVVNVANKFEWKMGGKKVVANTVSRGLREMWTSILKYISTLLLVVQSLRRETIETHRMCSIYAPQRRKTVPLICLICQSVFGHRLSFEIGCLTWEAGQKVRKYLSRNAFALPKSQFFILATPLAQQYTFQIHLR